VHGTALPTGAFCLRGEYRPYHDPWSFFVRREEKRNTKYFEPGTVTRFLDWNQTINEVGRVLGCARAFHQQQEIVYAFGKVLEQDVPKRIRRYKAYKGVVLAPGSLEAVRTGLLALGLIEVKMHNSRGDESDTNILWRFTARGIKVYSGSRLSEDPQQQERA